MQCWRKLAIDSKAYTANGSQRAAPQDGGAKRGFRKRRRGGDASNSMGLVVRASPSTLLKCSMRATCQDIFSLSWFLYDLLLLFALV